MKGATSIIAIVAEIETGARLRPADQAAVAALAASMNAEGLMQPIGVTREDGASGYRLIWGLHRLEAARQLGWERIPALHVASEDLGSFAHERRDRAREYEALENLCRADLSPWDRAVTVVALRDLMKADFDRKTVKFTVFALADRLGRSLSSVEKDIGLHDALDHGLAEALRGRKDWGKSSVLTAISKAPAERQKAALEWLSRLPEAGLKDVLRWLFDAPADATDGDAAFLGAVNRLTRMPMERRIEALEAVGNTLDTESLLAARELFDSMIELRGAADALRGGND